MKRFLIVDDEILSLTILKDFLSEFAHCDGAQNGKTAYEMFEKAVMDGKPYDLICSDIVMPEMGGHELVHKVRDREKSLPVQHLLHTKIFMISTSSTPKDMTCALWDNDCDDYVVKPFQREQLKSLLEKYNLID
ncbi:MAG: response regulator [Desulfuromonadales bacterium]